MMPSPHLNLIKDNPSKEMTRTPTLETPGLPLEAPSKKIAADDEIDQKELNATLSPRYLHGGEKTGLIIRFPTTFEQDPNRNESGKEETG